MSELAGKVALVTGAGRGLGRACAERFARAGARVAVADFDHVTGEQTAAHLREQGADARFIRADVSKEAEVEAMIADAIAAFGRIDCAVNNAMIGMAAQPLADIALEDWERTMAVNFTGVFLCLKYEIRAMLDQGGGGAIVNIGSGNEHSAEPGLSWYLAAKQGVYAMTKIAALDYAKQGIRVNAVAPGPMWTPALRETAAENPNHIERRAAHVPLGRIAEPEEIAEAVLWLCSPSASYVLGHTLAADGGYVLS